ncbi:MAG TPA: DUF1501 domain-containing protein [Pirellulales bacterium]|nr:DUF1501 domain-containing protein [Pirellulales bacterium]
MLRFLSKNEPNRGRMSRREWLRISGLASLAGLGAGRSTGAGEQGASRNPGFGKARSVILVYASGGQSQIDLWDPKPQAPAEVRGEFAPIATAVPGTFVCEHMPRLAALADRYAIVRSLSHNDLDHGSAGYLALTGRYHPQKSSNPPPRPTDEPTYGALLKRVRPVNRFPYEAIHINGPALVPALVGPGQDGGLLGREYEPLVLGDVSQGRVAVAGLDPQAELPAVRLEARQSLKQAVDGFCRQFESNRQMRDMNQHYAQAFELLSSPRSRAAFDLAAEPPALRDRYGRNRSGQACLLARRLVEADVPWITVIWNHSNRGQDTAPDDTDQYGWDTHNDIFEALKLRLLPRFDQGFSALLEDLGQRGLLDQTLVVCMGEFGRAPLVALEKRFAGSTPGRKHWANVYSAVLAGAGVTRGAVYGESDRLGGYPLSDRVGPWDVAATMFSALGIDPATHYTDSLGRPFPITIGRPIEGLYRG